MLLFQALYWSIRSEKLEWAVDEEDAARPEKDQPSPSAGKISSPFLQMAQDPTMPTYKQGILARKMHHDADGKKTPWGKRGWKMFHTLLRGMVLYFLKVGRESTVWITHFPGLGRRRKRRRTEKLFVDRGWDLGTPLRLWECKADGNNIILEPCQLLKCYLELS